MNPSPGNTKSSIQKDQFCKHLSSTKYKAPVVNFSQNKPYFSYSFDKSVQSLVFFVISNQLAFSALQGAVLSVTNWLCRLKDLLWWVTYSILQHSKESCPNILIPSKFKEVSFSGFMFLWHGSKNLQKGKNIYPKVIICHCHITQNEN